MMLAAPVEVPPIVAPGASTSMPDPPLATAAVPAALVPIRLPSTRQFDPSMRDAVDPVSRDDVGGTGRGPADRGTRGVDKNAIAAVGFRRPASDIRPDVTADHAVVR